MPTNPEVDTLKDLHDMADALGLTIEHKRLHGRRGEYRHDLKRIRLKLGMTYRLERSILAHELGHAVFEDVPSKFGPVAAKQERRAWEWAALRLISADDYQRAERIHHGHVGALAVELNVIVDVVEAYQRVLLRIGETVYEQPRMGAGQYSAKVNDHA